MDSSRAGSWEAKLGIWVGHWQMLCQEAAAPCHAINCTAGYKAYMICSMCLTSLGRGLVWVVGLWMKKFGGTVECSKLVYSLYVTESRHFSGSWPWAWYQSQDGGYLLSISVYLGHIYVYWYWGCLFLVFELVTAPVATPLIGQIFNFVLFMYKHVFFLMGLFARQGFSM